MIGRLFELSSNKINRTAFITLFFITTGSYLGYRKSYAQAQIANQDVSHPHLQQYESEDHLNLKIQTTKKPAVIYYYQPAVRQHYILRQALIRASNCYSDKATFWLVNTKKHFEKVKQELTLDFPLQQFMIQIRYPESECEVKYKGGDITEQIVKRRQFFNHEYFDETGLQSFLEQNGIKNASDPLSSFFRISNRSIFDDITITK